MLEARQHYTNSKLSMVFHVTPEAEHVSLEMLGHWASFHFCCTSDENNYGNNGTCQAISSPCVHDGLGNPRNF